MTNAENKPFLIYKNHEVKNVLLYMSRKGTLKFLFFLASNLLPFSIGNNTLNSSGFFLQNGGQSRRSQIDMLSFLENIKYKTKLTLQSDTIFVFRYVLLVHSIIFAGQPLFTNFILLRSEDRGGILSLNQVWRTSLILMIERSI